MAKANLQWQIYFSVFNKPRYQSEIGELIYGKQTSYPQLSGKDKKEKSAIQKCISKGMIKKVKVKIPKTTETREYDFKKRQYYIAIQNILSNEIIKKIEKETKKELESEEKLKIEILINHPYLKELINLTLFTQDNPDKLVYLKESADPDIIIQSLSFLCSHANIIMSLSGYKSSNLNHVQLKSRLDQMYTGNFKNNSVHVKSKTSKKIMNINTKYTQELFTKFYKYLFKKEEIDIKTLNSITKSPSASFFLSLQLLGSPLLNKISKISVFDDIIKMMYLEIASIIVPGTYAYYNIKYPEEGELAKLKNPPAFLQPIKETLSKFKQDIESISQRQAR